MSTLGQNATGAVDLSPWLPAGADAAAFNLTGTDVTASTYLSAWADGQSQPTASDLNLVAGQSAANFAVVPVSAARVVDVYNHVGQADAIVDLAGYFAPQLAACTGGCAYGFGTDGYGQFGNGVTEWSPATATPAYGLSGVTAVTGTNQDSYALRSDGTVWAWGSGSGGALGNGTSGVSATGAFDYATVPVQVAGLSNVVAIADGFALRNDGTVWSWGYNYMWRLGDGSTDDTGVASTPVQVSGLTGVVAIAGDISNGYALRNDGTVWSWGQNVQGELGNGTTGNETTCSANEGISPDGPNCASAVPVQVSGLTGVTAIGPARAVKSDGTVWRWGPKDFPNQDSVPVRVPGLTNVTAVAAGPSDYALRSDGTVWAWGLYGNGSLGNGSTCTSGDCYQTTPVQVSGLTNATALAVGVVTGYALRADGTVVAWGGGQDGELGDGQFGTRSSTPVQVPGLTGVTAIGDYGHVIVGTP